VAARSPGEQRFFDLQDQVRRHGLSDEVAALEGCIDDTTNPSLQGEMAKLLGFYWLRRGDPAKAAYWSGLACQRLPADRDAAYNAAYACFLNGEWEATVTRARSALHRCGEHFLFYTILSAALGALGRMTEVRIVGTRCLELKAETTLAPAFDLSQVPVPPFTTAQSARNVIAFSLFGAQRKYLDGALLNARAAPFLYPGWTCRFYVDASVPPQVVQALQQQGAQVMSVNGLPADPYGMFWRFLVADDATVDRYVLRNADSLINVRERVAVDAWIDSGRHFHVMRDHFDHADLILAGLWGGVRGALPPLLPAIRAWLANTERGLGYSAERTFLREALWPTVRQSVLTHDSQFDFNDDSDFPSVGRLPPGCWVGCDWPRLQRTVDLAV
jgi:hypothetical protein